MAAAGSGHADFSKSGFGTKVLHCGQEPDATTGAVAVPISMSTTFAQVSPGIASGADSHLSYHKGYEYSRTNNPTRAAFEQACAAAEDAKHGLAYASGMSATTAIIHLLKTGDHVVSIDDVYGGTQRFFRRTVVPTYGINFSFVDTTDFAALEAAFQENTKLVWLETPTNPTLKVSDIKAIAEIAHKHNALLVVDNTFMSPYFQQPLNLGADITMSSVTKYINGHSDVVMGFVGVNSDELNEKLRFIQNGLGAIPSPFDSYQALRGLKTLHIRMERHGENALKLASFLEKHDMVEKVLYPGLSSHPQHEVAKKNAVNGSGGSGMITFYVKGKLDAARVFLENVKVFTLAESLGAVESLVEHPAIMTHASVPAEDREKLGISDTLIRLSVGIENYEDLEADVDAALKAAAKTL